MEQFTIYCTPEQTKKALELGAPIKMVDNDGFSRCIEDRLWEQIIEQGFIYIDGDVFAIPTAEQMIGWLDNYNIFINVFWDDCVYGLEIKDIENNDIPKSKSYFNSRKEATIAAIDAVLEYLSNKK